MNRSRISVLVVLLAIPLSWACRPKPPLAPAPPTSGPTTSTPVSAPPVATPVDETADELPADIAELNAHVARTGLLGDVYFAYDESALDESARDRLARNADFFRTHPDYLVTVEGHCDSRGTNDYNLALGERRATAATSYLRNVGVGSELRTVSYGEERPVCWEEQESCWSQNRRAHFVITGRSGAH